MKAHSLSETKRAWFRVGPGLLCAVVMAAALVAVGQLFPKPLSDPSMGSIVWEADAHGRLHRVSAPTAVKQTAVPRLWKPEVSLLLEPAYALHLTAEQRAALNTLNGAWQREKNELEEQMNPARTQARVLMERATPERAASATQMMRSLGEYSTLSTQYNLRRAAYWNQGIAILTVKQKREFEKLSEATKL